MIRRRIGYARHHRHGGKQWSGTALLAAALSASGAMAGSAAAASFFWTGDHDTVWNTTGGPANVNWSSSDDFDNDSNALPGSGDDVYFNLPGAVNLNTTLGQDFSINSLSFTQDDTSGVTIGGGNTLTIGAGGLTNNASASNLISTAVTLGANQTWTNNTSSAVTVSGAVGGSGINLTLAGSETFILSGANSYSGSTSLSGNGTTLDLSGSSGSLNTSGISLDGGTVLEIDNTSGNNTNRIGDSVGISSRGGTVYLMGSTASETVGTLTLTTGLTNVNADAGAALTLGSASLASFARSSGAAVNFSSTGTFNVPNVTLSSGIIGGWATVGNPNSSASPNTLDFATVSGGQIAPLATYNLNDFTAPGNNTKVDGSAGTVTLTAASTTINSLYLTGTGNISLSTTTNTLVIGSGGIIANAGTQTLASYNTPSIPNALVLGNGIVNTTFNSDGDNKTAASTTVGQLGKITSSGPDLIVTTASNLRINAQIFGSIGLTKDGSGILDLSNGNWQGTYTAGSFPANTYTGNTTINGGTLIIGNDSGLGAVPATNTPNSLVLNGGTLLMTRTFTFSSQRGVMVGPQGGTIAYNGGNTTILQPYQIAGSGAMTYFSEPFINNAGASPAPLANAIEINTTSGANTYSGPTTFETMPSNGYGNAIGSVIFFNANNQVPNTSAVTVTSIPNSNSSIGLLNLSGHSETFGSLSGNGYIINVGTTAAALTVGQNNLSTTYSGDLGAQSQTFSVGAASHTNGDHGTSATNVSLTKVGTGTLNLSGFNDYTGATAINGGTLLVGNGTSTTGSASLSTTPVTVGNGSAAAALGGNGTIYGPVTVSSSGHLDPAMSPTTTNTLTLNGNLTLNAGATLDYNFGASAVGSFGTGDLVQEYGTLAVPSSGTITLNITALPGFGNGGGSNTAFYDLIDASGGVFPGSSTFNWSINGSTSYNYAVLKPGDANYPSFASNAYVLEVLQGNPTLTWVGNDATNPTFWDTNTPNWTSAGAGNVFSTGANVIFDDSASTGTVAVQSPGMSPNSIVFNNNSLSYVFSGSPITVTAGAGIVKNQLASVTFNTSVTSAKTTINAGSISVGAASTFDGGVINVGLAGSLNVAGAGRRRCADGERSGDIQQCQPNHRVPGRQQRNGALEWTDRADGRLRQLRRNHHRRRRKSDSRRRRDAFPQRSQHLQRQRCGPQRHAQRFGAGGVGHGPATGHQLEQHHAG